MAGWVYQRGEIDSGNNGSIDAITYYFYDSNGNMIRNEFDNDNDGFMDEITYYFYDSNGNRIRNEFDNDNDGFMDEVRYFTYDSNGNQTSLEVDDGNDGSIDVVESYAYDSSGHYTGFEYDDGDDGSIDVVGYATNDLNGNMTRLEIDEGVDGSIDEVRYFTYDSNGNQISLEFDFDNDGSVDLTLYLTNDLNGHLVKIESDYNNDGFIDAVTHLTSWIYIQGPGEPAVPWVQIGGEITYEGIPLCAMVLANGQHMFTGNPVGEYSLSVPLDAHDEITLYAFCSGKAPFKRILTYEEATNFDINMQPPGSSLPMNVIYQLSPSFSNPDWVTISGRITAGNGTPLCAMALANGQSMFTSNPIGDYSLDVPLDDNGEITLQVFCSGQAPFKQIISDIPVFPDVARFAGNYSGTYSGDDYGTWTAVIDSQGYISGSYYSQQFIRTVSISGSVNASGALTMATGGTSSGATFVGQIYSSGNVQGTWDNPYDNYSGTFTGSKTN
ncbi:MAG: hypothetical protein JW896_09050 [Deltaproteobacteria bacterium]|nr:hypothetical protein [Deltaproteobacteria bacterium]